MKAILLALCACLSTCVISGSVNMDRDGNSYGINAAAELPWPPSSKPPGKNPVLPAK